MKTFPLTADLEAAFLTENAPAGIVINTLGDLAINDGGGATWITTGDSSGEIQDARGNGLNKIKQEIAGDLGVATVVSDGSTTARTLEDRFADVVNVKDFGAVGDGSADDTAAIQSAINSAEVNNFNVYLPSGTYKITQPILVKKSVILRGAGPRNIWDDTSLGKTEIISYDGVYAGERWSDTVDGNMDNTSFKPMLVLFGNAKVSDLTLSSNDDWDAGFYLPSTRRVKIDNCTVDPTVKHGLFMDATWATDNTTLTSIHPDIETEGAMNECAITNCFFQGSSYSLNLHGTTRDPNVEADWFWCPGGASDVTFNATRFSGGTSLGIGGTIRIDAAIDNDVNIQAVNRIWFTDCSFRGGNSRYNIHLNRVGTVQFVNCSGETYGGVSPHPDWVGSNAPFYITDHTKYVQRVNDSIIADIEYDGANYGRRLTYAPGRPTVDTISGWRGETSNRVFDRSNQDSGDTSFNTGDTFYMRMAYKNGSIVPDGTCENMFTFVDGGIRGHADDGVAEFIDTSVQSRMIVTPLEDRSISGGSLDASHASYIRIVGSETTLTNITGGIDGQHLILHSGSNSLDITATEAGNLLLAGNFIGTRSADTLTLIATTQTGSLQWREVSRSIND